MSERYLTEERFERWATKFEEKLDMVIEKDQTTALILETRLTALEITQKNAGTIVAWLSGIVASIVTAAILWGVKLFGGK
jgi:hypothetical protein